MYVLGILYFILFLFIFSLIFIKNSNKFTIYAGLNKTSITTGLFYLYVFEIQIFK